VVFLEVFEYAQKLEGWFYSLMLLKIYYYYLDQRILKDDDHVSRKPIFKSQQCHNVLLLTLPKITFSWRGKLSSTFLERIAKKKRLKLQETSFIPWHMEL